MWVSWVLLPKVARLCGVRYFCYSLQFIPANPYPLLILQLSRIPLFWWGSVNWIFLFWKIEELQVGSLDIVKKRDIMIMYDLMGNDRVYSTYSTIYKNNDDLEITVEFTNNIIARHRTHSSEKWRESFFCTSQYSWPTKAVQCRQTVTAPMLLSLCMYSALPSTRCSE